MRVTAPVALGNRIAIRKPDISSTTTDVRIRHSEYVGEVSGSVNFNLSASVIQPGLSGLFPWLAKVAALYESYQFNYLAFSFKTEKSTATNGAVMMAVDFDVSDSPPPSKQQLMAYHNAQRTQPWCDMTYVCNINDVNKLKPRYVRTGLVAGTDYKIYDVGNLFVATQGCADTSILGELYVHYDIVFRTPQLDNAGYAAQGSNRSIASGAVTGTLLLGTSPTLNVAGSGMPILYNTTTGAISFPDVGSYLITYTCFTTAAASGTITPVMSGGSLVSPVVSAGSATVFNISFTVNVLNSGDSLTMTGLTLPGGNAAVLRIASYPFGL